MDPTALADCFGTYRAQQEATPSQRRALHWWNLASLAALTIWVVVVLVRQGLEAALSLLIWVAVAIAVGVVNALIGRRLGPWTRIDATGITARSGLTGGRGAARWDEVAHIDVPQRFEEAHAAVLTTGTRIELPGLPATVIERLSSALGTTSPHSAPQSQRPPTEGPDADASWDGPFRRG